MSHPPDTNWPEPLLRRVASECVDNGKTFGFPHFSLSLLRNREPNDDRIHSVVLAGDDVGFVVDAWGLDRLMSINRILALGDWLLPVASLISIVSGYFLIDFFGYIIEALFLSKAYQKGDALNAIINLGGLGLLILSSGWIAGAALFLFIFLSALSRKMLNIFLEGEAVAVPERLIVAIQEQQAIDQQRENKISSVGTISGLLSTFVFRMTLGNVAAAAPLLPLAEKVVDLFGSKIGENAAAIYLDHVEERSRDRKHPMSNSPPRDP